MPLTVGVVLRDELQLRKDYTMDKWFYAWLHLQNELRDRQPRAYAISTSDDLVSLLGRLIYPIKVKADGKFDRTVKHVDSALECLDLIIRASTRGRRIASFA